MSLWKNLVAGAAAVVVYKVVDSGLRKFERSVLGREVEEDEPSWVEKDAIVLAGSRIDHIPTVRERDQIAYGLNLGLGMLGTTLAAEVKERFITNGEVMFGRSLLFSLGSYAAIEMLLRPALGIEHHSGHARRFTAFMLSKATQSAVRSLLD